MRIASPFFAWISPAEAQKGGRKGQFEKNHANLL